MDKEDIEKQNELITQLERLGIFTKDILNLSEACFYMGIKKSTLYKLTSAKKITYFCPHGKLIFFRKSDLDLFLLTNKQETLDEIKAKAETFIYNKSTNNKNIRR